MSHVAWTDAGAFPHSSPVVDWYLLPCGEQQAKGQQLPPEWREGTVRVFRSWDAVEAVMLSTEALPRPDGEGLGPERIV